jgi:hypothetical protein
LSAVVVARTCKSGRRRLCLSAGVSSISSMYISTGCAAAGMLSWRTCTIPTQVLLQWLLVAVLIVLQDSVVDSSFLQLSIARRLNIHRQQLLLLCRQACYRKQQAVENCLVRCTSKHVLSSMCCCCCLAVALADTVCTGHEHVHTVVAVSQAREPAGSASSLWLR